MAEALRLQTATTDVDYLVNRNPFVLPDFQRGEVWDVKKKSALIVSLLQGYAMPPLVVIKGERQKVKHLLDGLQRFTAIRKFLNDEYRLKLPEDLEIEPELRAKIEGKKFSELPADLKASLEQAKVLIMEYEVPKEKEAELLDIALELFKRLNRNPTPLKTGHLLYILTYIPEITPMISQKIAEISPKEDKNRDIFRAVARYLTLVENYDLFKRKEVNYPPGKYYSFVKNTLVYLKEDYLSQDEKGREELKKEIKKYLDDFERMHKESFNYLNKVFYKRLLEEKMPQLVKEYIEKHNNDKEFKKFLKRLSGKVSEKEAKQMFMTQLKKKAEESAKMKISTQARKLAESYSIYKKVWVGDVFGVFEVKAQDLGYRSMKKFMEEVGNEAFLRLIEDKDFRNFVQDKKRDNRIWEFINFGEKAIEEVLQKQKEKEEEEKQARQKLDEVLETLNETENEMETKAENETEKELSQPSQLEKSEDIDIDLDDALPPKKIVEDKLRKRKFKL